MEWKRQINSRIMLVAFLTIAADSTILCADDRFRDDVAPILERHCIGCHNDSQQEGGLSFQTRESAFADGYIEPNDSSNSRIIDAIMPVDGEAEMPKDTDPLTDAQIESIRRWIDDGANWPDGLELTEPSVSDFDWWSYQPIENPQVPQIDDDWIETPIDAFVLAKLQEKGLEYSPAADRRTLIRRVTYDLTGMPPTPEEVESFVNDSDPRAYGKLVDRLLESEHYGERWARHWLDVVKYADTCGYDKDKLRPNAWPYRDYVIKSLNQDKPYGRFIQEQIAGDVLFPGEPDGILGLGFVAAGPWDFIGHVEVPESKIDGQVARNLDRDDMVSNTLNTFCSVTIQCARCHNHKFDPISQEHYYGLQAVFAAVDRAERVYDLDPEIQRRRAALQEEIASLQSSLGDLDREIDEAGGERLSELNEAIERLNTELKLEKEPEFGFHSAISDDAGIAKSVSIDLGQSTQLGQIVLAPCHDEFGGIGAGFGFPVRFRVEIANEPEQWKVVLDRTQEAFPNPGIKPVVVSEFDGPVRWIRVTATELADRRGVYIFALSEVLALDKDGANVAIGRPVESTDSIEAPVRWSRSNLTDGKWPRYNDSELAAELARSKSERADLLADIQTPERMSQRASLNDRIHSATEEMNRLPAGRVVYAAATDFNPQGQFKPTGGTPRMVRVLARGDVQTPGEIANPGFLPLEADADWIMEGQLSEGERRANLARWLTRKDHPLVWRSIVNRIWQYHFGQGIVATPNDFGRMGAEPTHPELLDWLATYFRDEGQSFKSLHRMIVMSSVYQQAVSMNEANHSIDGSNQFLWRMNRRRLTAEEIRDSILAVSGALNRDMGGPGYYLFKLEKTEHSPHYEYHKFDPADANSHRRSIYRFIVRSQPDPWMTTLDCADSSQSTPRRIETLTALQALSLLNNRFNLYMSERFAERLEKESDDLAEQVERAMELVTQRSTTQMEKEELTAYAQEHGLANLCRVLFNLSEFVYVE